MTLDQFHNDPTIYGIACCVLVLCVYIFGYWVGCARGRYIERQTRKSVIEFYASAQDPMHIIVAPKVTPTAFADFGSN